MNKFAKIVTSVILFTLIVVGFVALTTMVKMQQPYVTMLGVIIGSITGLALADYVFG